MDSTLQQKLESIKQHCRSAIAAHEPIRQAEERARALVGQVPPAALFVGLCGVRIPVQEFELAEGFLWVRPVTNPPGLVHVVTTAKDCSPDYLHAARHSTAITAEIGAGNVAFEPDMNGRVLTLSYHAAALMKLCDQDFLICPASATTSWDAVASRPHKSIQYTVLDEAPRRLVGRPPNAEMSLSQLEWVRDVFEDSLKLCDHSTSRRFGHAFNTAYTWNHTDSPRTALSNIWCGLEALFGDAHDRPTSKGMAKRIAAWLPGTSASDVLDLYEARCDAVHGRWVDDSDILQPLTQSIGLLVNAIRTCINENKQTLPDWQ